MLPVPITSTPSSRSGFRRAPTIHDFYGFPEQLYRFHYEVPGSPELAARAAELLAPVPVAQTDRWGLDHGAWTVLMHAFPEADIPVVQLSLDRGLSPAEIAPGGDVGIAVLEGGQRAAVADEHRRHAIWMAHRNSVTCAIRYERRPRPWKGPSGRLICRAWRPIFWQLLGRVANKLIQLMFKQPWPLCADGLR